MLTKNEILKYIQEYNLVSDYKNLDIQLQPNGIDLTISKIYSFVNGNMACLDFDNSNRVLRDVDELEPYYGSWTLVPGSYLLRFNETIKLPEYISALTLPRSSLIRNGGYTIGSIWDRGYIGQGVNLLILTKSMNIEKDARLVQMIFFKGAFGSGYSGIFLNEKE